MTCHTDMKGEHYMEMRKILHFNSALGLTLPKEFTRALGLERGNYAEVFLRDNKTIVIKRHGVKPNKITIEDK